jgi:hypothetical protein
MNACLGEVYPVESQEPDLQRQRIAATARVVLVDMFHVVQPV